MEIKRSIELHDILSYTTDAGAVYLLAHFGKSALLSVFDPLSFTITDDFQLEFHFNYFSTPCVDEDFVYLPTNESQILVIDKFSGDRVSCINIGSSILADDIQQDEDSIYTLCGIPLSNGVKVTTDSFCVSAHDKKSGKKKYQSSSIMGKPGDARFLTIEDKIWASINKKLIVLDKDCQKEEEFDLRYYSSFRPVVADNFVICASNQGHLEVFKKQDMKKYGGISVSQGSTSPICIGDVLYWFVNEGLLKIDIKTLSADVIKISSSVQSNAVVLDRSIYIGDKNGNVIEFNIEDRSCNSLKVSDDPLWKTVVMNKRLLILSKNRLYEIGV